MVGGDLFEKFPWSGDIHELLWLNPASGTIVIVALFGLWLWLSIATNVYIAFLIVVAISTVSMIVYDFAIHLLCKFALQYLEEKGEL